MPVGFELLVDPNQFEDVTFQLFQVTNKMIHGQNILTQMKMTVTYSTNPKFRLIFFLVDSKASCQLHYRLTFK